jgi:hypothetical protein
MSLPTCFPILNTNFFGNLVNEINGATSEAQLQALVTRAFAEISMMESTLTSQLAFLEPIEALLTPPTNLAQLVTFAQSVITNVIEPLLKPVLNVPLQLAAIATEVATVTAAIEAIASGKGFSITIPSISIGCTL